MVNYTDGIFEKPVIDDINYRIRGHANLIEVVHVVTDDYDLQELVRRIIQRKNKKKDDGPFIICDLGEVVRRFNQMSRCLPDIRSYYALKANSDHCISQLLFNLGTGFDCASRGEIEQVAKYGAKCDDIIFAVPIKFASHIRYCCKTDIPYMTFDTKDELDKIELLYPAAKPIIRIHAMDETTQTKLSEKFGAHMDDVDDILAHAQQKKKNIAGVSFHVGWGCTNPYFMNRAFEDAFAVIKKIVTNGNFDKEEDMLLDIGGGFPGYKGTDGIFEQMATEITSKLHQEMENYKKGPRIKVISEPGTYFNSSSMTVVTQIIGKKPSRCDNTEWEYYLNDGLHGTFSSIQWGQAEEDIFPELLLTEKDGESYPDGKESHRSVIWGPTPNSVDVIAKDIMLPEMKISDYIMFHNMGHYGQAMSSTEFAAIPKVPVIYIIEEKYQRHINCK